MGGGWYFSGVIHRDALEVDHTPSTPGLSLTPEAAGRVRVSGDNPADLETLADGSTYGVEWADGYGQVIGPATVADDGVVRDLAVLAGDPFAAATPATLDRDAFPEDPEVALGLGPDEVEEVDIPGRGDASLPAWFAPGEEDTWAVLVHGKGGTPAEMLRMMRSTVAAGMPSLDIGYRNDEGLLPDDSGEYRYGATEWRDLDAAVRFAERRGAEQVVLVGASMGGGIVASYLREVPDAPVAGVVLDSPMLDLGATVSFGASRRDFPVWGHVPEPLTWTAKRITTLRYGLDWGEVDYLEDTAWLDVPALVFHGTEDTTVPVDLSERLAASRPELVDLLTTSDAGHVESWNLDPERYDAALRAFLDSL